MSTISSAGIASTWSAMRPDPQQQAAHLAALRQEAAPARAEAAPAVQAVEEARPAAPPAGQGRHVDRRA